MKRVLQVAAVCCCFVFMSLPSPAQFNIGGGVAMNNYKGKGYKKAHTALQFRIGYSPRNTRYFFNAGFNFSPSVGRENAYITSFDPNVDEYYIQQQVRINNAFLHLGYLFFPPEKDFHIRVFGGTSLDMLNLKYVLDERLPASDKQFFTDTSMTGWKVDFGAGIDFRLGSGKLFVEYTFGMPANTVNDMPYANPTVAHKGVTIGYSYIFGSRRNYFY